MVAANVGSGISGNEIVGFSLASVAGVVKD